MKINNCFLAYSPFLQEHTISTECKKPETAIKRFTAVLCEVMAGYTDRFDFGALVRDTFNSPDVYLSDDGSFRRCFSCVSSGLMFDTTVSLTATFHDGVYLLCIAFTSFDKTFTSFDKTYTKDTSEDTKDTSEDTKDTPCKSTVVKPVLLSLSPLLEVRTGGEYPFRMVLSDGRLAWDFRSRVYNDYMADLIGASPAD